MNQGERRVWESFNDTNQSAMFAICTSEENVHIQEQIIGNILRTQGEIHNCTRKMYTQYLGRANFHVYQCEQLKY